MEATLEMNFKDDLRFSTKNIFGSSFPVPVFAVSSKTDMLSKQYYFHPILCMKRAQNLATDLNLSLCSLVHCHSTLKPLKKERFDL